MKMTNGTGLSYDVTVAYGKDEDMTVTYRVTDVVTIKGYENVHPSTGDDSKTVAVSDYNMLVNFFRADGVLVGSFQRANIQSVMLVQ